MSKIDDENFLKKITLLGKGKKSLVWLVKNPKDGQKFALKEIEISAVQFQKEAEHLLNEKAILLKISESFLINSKIPKLFKVFKDDFRLFFLMEFVEGKNLAQILRELRETPGGLEIDLAKFVAFEILKILKILHSNFQILYRDLKTPNVLVNFEGRIFLCDFGLSKILENSGRTNSFCGTLHAMAPEILANDFYGFFVDFWAFGVFLYEIVENAAPFGFFGEIEKFRENVKNSPGNLKFLKGRNFENFKDLVKNLLNFERAGRLTDFEKIEKHKFFKEIFCGEEKLRNLVLRGEGRGSTALENSSSEILKDPFEDF